MANIHWTEIVFTVATFILLTTYHIHWLLKSRRAPFETYLGLTRHLRRAWVESVINDKRDILSVQSLRNSIMASSFLASTAILIGLGLLSMVFKPEHITDIPSSHFTMAFAGFKTLFPVKLMVLAVHFFFAFFSFTLSIRYLNQVNFMINVPIEYDPLLSPEFIANTLEAGMAHYTMGMRAYYLAVVVALWLFGPAWMFSGSIVLVLVLYKLDHCCALDYSTARCDLGARSREAPGASSRQ